MRRRRVRDAGEGIVGFYTYDRMGGQDVYDDDADVVAVIAGLLEQLAEDPDDREHAEVSVHHGDWYVSARASGVLALGCTAGLKAGRRTRGAVPTLYRRAARKADVARTLARMAAGGVEAVRKAAWVPRDQLPAGKADLFR